LDIVPEDTADQAGLAEEKHIQTQEDLAQEAATAHHQAKEEDSLRGAIKCS